MPVSSRRCTALRPNARYALAALILGLIVFSVSQYPVPSVRAAADPTVSAPTNITNPNIGSITVHAIETDNGSDIVVRVTGGQLTPASCFATATQCTSFVTSGGPAAIITITTATDGDGNANEPLTLVFGFAPPIVGSDTNVDVLTCQSSGCTANNVQATITIHPQSSSGGSTASTSPTIFVTASPNVISCGGGTSVITATAVDQDGNTVAPVEIHFRTNGGLLEPSGLNTANLTVPPSFSPSQLTDLGFTVTADAVGFGQGTVLVQIRCFVSVVVTADPNVVACGGKSTITASARDPFGHVVVGVGFHFSTDKGNLLVGPPQTAFAEQEQAVLTMPPPGQRRHQRPGDGKSQRRHRDRHHRRPGDGPTALPHLREDRRRHRPELIGEHGWLWRACVHRRHAQGRERQPGAGRHRRELHRQPGQRLGSGRHERERLQHQRERHAHAAHGERAFGDRQHSRRHDEHHLYRGRSRLRRCDHYAASGASFATIVLNVNCSGAQAAAAAGAGVRPPNTGTGILPPNTGSGGIKGK